MKVDHISLLLSSLETSMPYYDCLLPQLGFSKKHAHVWTDGAGFFFQFRQAHPDTRPYQRYGAGMNHLGFGASSVEQIQAIRQNMQDAGFPVPEMQRIGDSCALFMKDPDGIRFEITYYAPGTSVVD
jgi:lactoylglutathione lyase